MNFSTIYWGLIALMLGNMGILVGSAEPTTSETEALIAIHINKQGQLLYTVTGTAGVYVYKGICLTNRYEKVASQCISLP